MHYSARRAALVACIFFSVVFPAVADTVTNLLSPFEWAQAVAINSRGWVVGQTAPGEPDWVALLWIPDGGSSITGTPLIVPWQAASSSARDIHDNGDILVEFFGIDLIGGYCASSSCIPGSYYAVVHAAGGPLLSRTDYYFSNSEWLADLGLWGPILPRQTNAKGQHLLNLGGDPGTGVCSPDYPCQAQLITPDVPEPSSVVLLATVAGIVALSLRRRRRL